MFRLSSQRHLCLACRISSFTQQSCRSVSTSSAINRGLKATRDDGEPKRGGRDRSKRSTYQAERSSETRKRPNGFSRDSQRPSASSRRDKPAYSPDIRRDRPSTRDFDRQRRQSDVPYSDNKRASQAKSNSRLSGKSDASESKSGSGFMKGIKLACKLVKQIQEREAAGQGVDEMVKDLQQAVSIVNSFAKSGSFREEPSEAVASILEKQAAEGTFVRGQQRSAKKTVICQRSDGAVAVSVGRGGPSEEPAESKSPSSGARVSKETNGSRTERERRPLAEKSANRRRRESTSRQDDEDDDIPEPLPYTTAASEFLYGYNTVLAALRAWRRKLYKLYIHPKIFGREAGPASGGSHRSGEMAADLFVQLAKEADVPFRNEFKTKLLDRMSDGRAHNGLLLETSKLPAPPVLSLGRPNLRNSTIPIQLARQSAEDAEVNGTPETINSVADTWRHPLIVLLDGITDPGNMGNIIRTCHFYGVDAVAIANNTCSTLSSGVLAKASSGACEAMRILSVPSPSNFAYDSAKNGWKIYASVAPTHYLSTQSTHFSTAAVATSSPLAKHPCILMLGAEGEGLRESLRKRAHSTVSIEGGKKVEGTPNVGLDSINVSVATGVLVDAFLRKPADAPEKKDTTGELGW